MTVKNTPLKSSHESLGAKMVDFHGWYMPAHYSSIMEEHKAVREKVGIFDICHMGEVYVNGEHAMELLQRLTSNDLTLLEDGMAQYSTLLNEDGGIIDDLLIYRVSARRYFLCVNASNTKGDVSWIADNALQYPDVEVANVSRDYGMIAVQGPLSENLLQSVTRVPLAKLEYYRFQVGLIEDRNVIISRTGYTGEDGFEIYCDWRDSPALWDRLLGKGKQFGVKPIGLGARDTLRMEMRYPLHGQDICEKTTLLEAGLGWILKLGKEGGFNGREALLKQKQEGVKRKFIGLEMVERGIPRSGYEIYSNDEKVGKITSGTMSPTLKKAIGLGYVRADLAAEGVRLFVDIRGKKVEAVCRKEPFVKSAVKRPAPVEASQ
ncbi:Aminomethyltransferase (glycine cleavage system T protein) [hydrothermal vent metagenome]|uniref:aminomethyltransferase n=1 Tax=hydrothermal vent metagenome TaxID=652676 RepID=A0A3B1C679_9ZZZZ